MFANIPMEPPALINFDQGSRRRRGAEVFFIGDNLADLFTTTESNLNSAALEMFNAQMAEVVALVEVEAAEFEDARNNDFEKFLESL